MSTLFCSPGKNFPGPAHAGPGGKGEGTASGRQQVGRREILAQGLIQQSEHHQAQDDAGQHVASVIDQGVDPGAGHGLAEERVGHPLAPHKDADEEMRQKAQHAADDRAIVNAPLAAGQQACAKAQCHKGDEVVADDGGPVNGELVADEVGDGAVHQARQRAPAAAVPGGEQDDGQHLQGDGAAVGELIELDEAEDLRHGDEDGSLTDHACFADFHVFFSSVKKISASRAAQASQCGYKAVWSHSYAGITRIRSEGPDGNTSHLSRLAPAPLGL